MKIIKKLQLILIGLLLIASRLTADSISEQKARILAINWKAHITKLKKNSPEINTVTTTVYRGEKTFYTYNFKNGGFVMVSADDNVKPVLGYSDDSEMPDNITNESLKGWLDSYNEQIYDIISNRTQFTANIIQKVNIQKQWENISHNRFSQEKNGKSVVDPLLTTKWDQGCYYNELCPSDNSGSCRHVLTGCVATAMAQILKFHNFPSKGTGSHSYSWAPYGTISADFGEGTYDWINMPDFLTTINQAVAKIMYHLGVAVNMQYSANTSGAYDIDAFAALQNYFHYSAPTYVSKKDYTISEWDALIKKDLDEGLPIYYTGSGGFFVGHAFVCDGYDSDDYFHINWGYSGKGNGYFPLSDLIYPITNANFSYKNAAIINIRPDTCALYSATIIPSGSTNLCEGESVVLKVNKGADLGYMWKKNNVVINGATLSVYSVNASGSYTVEVFNSFYCSATSNLIEVNVNNCGNKISGVVSYDNPLKTPIPNTTIYLENSAGNKIDSSLADSTGAFRFINLTNGTYKIVCENTPMKWRGVNPVDALIVIRNFVGLYKFNNELQAQAADVNNDNQINPLDALIINMRFVRQINHFVLPDWIFESPALTISDTSVTQDIKAICAGDVNRSFPK
jgi:hypothetical protein